MAGKIIDLYPSDCSLAKKRAVYARFSKAYSNAVDTQKRDLADALLHLVDHWTVSYQQQISWDKTVERDHLKIQE